MSAKPAPSAPLDTLRLWLDKVKEGNDSVYNSIPLFAENNSSHADIIVKLTYARIQNLTDRSSEDQQDLRVRYYYVLDAILKKLRLKYQRSIEEIVLPNFERDLKSATTSPDNLKALLIMFTSWEGYLSLNSLLACLKRFYQNNPQTVDWSNDRTSSVCSGERTNLKLRLITKRKA